MSIGLSLGPRSVERPADAGFAAVGVLDSVSPAKVDGAGLVQLAGSGWSLDWWIGADDRWYLPAREATIRQSRLSYGPVLETAMRIPSGDAKQRVYAATVRGQQVIVVEVENDSPVPVALGLAIRPYGLDGECKESSIFLEDDVLWVEGSSEDGKTATRVAIRLPRQPNEFGVSQIDVLDTVTSGGSLEAGDERATRTVDALAGGETNTGVVLYPLPHRTTLRFIMSDPVIDADSAPGPDDVAKGWQSIIDRGGRFSFPDPGLTQLAGVARSRLIGVSPQLPSAVAALAPGAGKILEGLALSGAADDVREPLVVLSRTFSTSLPGRASDAAAIMVAVGHAASLVDDPELVEGLLEPMAQITQLIERSGDSAATAEAFEGLASLLLVAGQPEPAQDLLTRANSLLAPVATHMRHLDGASSQVGLTGLAALTALAEEASPSGSWGDDSADKAAEFWIAARSLLIDDQPNPTASYLLRLLPHFPHAWKGGDVEVHGAATRFGRLSFGIRWHGYRPAILWDLESEQPVTITCQGLDPDWSTTEHRGEALLIGSAEDLPAVPVEGESFQ